jgi:DNA-binding transcriptional LysR family regulator
MSRRLADRDSTPAGVLRVTAPVALVARVLGPQLAQFHWRLPEIEVDQIVSGWIGELRDGRFHS